MSAYLAVIGGDPAPDDLLKVAEEVGSAIAERGAYLVCGGLGGVMEAACRGAKEAGGTTIGILPTADRSHANAFVDVAIPTGMGEMRNALIIRCAEASSARCPRSDSASRPGSPWWGSPRGSSPSRGPSPTRSCAPATLAARWTPR